VTRKVKLINIHDCVASNEGGGVNIGSVSAIIGVAIDDQTMSTVYNAAISLGLTGRIDWNNSDVWLMRKGVGQLALVGGLTAVSLSTVTLKFHDGTSMSTAGAGGGIPYVGASANVNLGAYNLTSKSISSESITCRGNNIVLDTYGTSHGGDLIRISNDGGGNGNFDFFVGVCGSPAAFNYGKATMTIKSGNTDTGTFAGELRLLAGNSTDQDCQGGHITIQGGEGNGTGGYGNIRLAMSGGKVIVNSSISAKSFIHSLSSAIATGTTITTNVLDGDYFDIVLSASVTLSNPINAVRGSKILWVFRQPNAGGPFTVALDSKFRFGATITGYTSSTVANVSDYFGAAYNHRDDKWDVISIAKGY
jgi:hypothetical protein